MNAHRWAATTALILLATAPGAARAQSLAERVSTAQADRVEFSFATRRGVCGDGQSYIHLADDGGNVIYGGFDGLTANACVHGPARVVLSRADGRVISIHIYVGPPEAVPTDGAKSLGTVPAADAAAYLLQLAGNAEGAVARDAIMPAMLADTVDNSAALVALARDRSRSRDTRRTAITWLSHGNREPASLVSVLVKIASDETDTQSVRQQALNALARLDNGNGLSALITLANDAQDGWVGRTALSALAQSGDPRSRDFLRGVVQRAAFADQALAVAVRGLGQQYATAADIAVIRTAWPKFTGERTQAAAIAAVAEFGGDENTAWLLSLGRDMSTTSSVRRRALESAARTGASTADLMRVYQQVTDPATKTAIISALGQLDDRAAVDALLTIARGDESVAARRSAVSVLGRSSDPRVKQALAGIVVAR